MRFRLRNSVTSYDLSVFERVVSVYRFFLFPFFPFFPLLRFVTNVGSIKGARGSLGGGLPRARRLAPGEIPTISVIRFSVGLVSNRFSITAFSTFGKLSSIAVSAADFLRLFAVFIVDFLGFFAEITGDFSGLFAVFAADFLEFFAVHLYSGPSGLFLKTKQLGARTYGVIRDLKGSFIVLFTHRANFVYS